MTWLLFAFALELGAIRGSDIPVDLSSYIQTEATAIIAEHLEIGGTLRSYQIPFEDYTWSPWRMDYTVAATVRFGMLSFGVEHMCYHAVDPVVETELFGLKRLERIPWGWSERAFIRIAIPHTRP